MHELTAQANYFDNSQNHPEQGMTLDDIRACESVAARRNEIIIFRSTGPWARPYIERGHPTKHFHVKGKSSTWGPHAGLVPYRCEFSKAVSQVDIDKGQKLNDEALRGGYAKRVNLSLHNDFIDKELFVTRGTENVSAVKRIERPRDGIVYLFAIKPGGGAVAPKPHVFLGVRNTQNRWDISPFGPEADGADAARLATLEAATTPLEVMRIPESHLPITGDYDLFAICPTFVPFAALPNAVPFDPSGKDRSPDTTLDNPAQNSSVARLRRRVYDAHQPFEVQLKAMEALSRIDKGGRPEDPHRGNLSARIFDVVCKLNAEMGAPYGEGHKLGEPNVYQPGIYNQRVHHNAESGRPFAPGVEDGLPLTVFQPIFKEQPSIGPYAFKNATITSREQLFAYFLTIWQAGFYPPRNRAWKMPNLVIESWMNSNARALLVANIESQRLRQAERGTINPNL